MNNDQNKNQEEDFDFERINARRHSAQNPYASSYSEDNSERHIRPREEYASRSYRRKVRKHPSELKFNWGALIFLLAVAVIVTVSVIRISKNPKKPADVTGELPKTEDTTPDAPPIVRPDDTAEENENIGGGDEGENTPDETQNKTFTVEANWSEEDDGFLILVNYDHGYSENADYIPVINTYEKRTSHFKVAGTNIELSPVVFTEFEKMVNGLEAATGCDDLIINSGYRTMADQQEIYDGYLESKGEEYVKDYVANPGESEHHTGYALDLSFYLDEGYSENVGIHEHGKWLTEHCSDYGFVVRYPEDKVEYTHIAYEPWHFRYVGVVHAKAMESLGLCLEEYITLLDGCSFDDKVIYLSDGGRASMMNADSLPENDGYAIYSVPVSDGEKTVLTVLGEEDAEYSVSGTNAGSFVVAVKLG